MTSRSLAICVAHPDDESYALYGSVALHAAEPDFRLAVLHATDGDAGEVAPGVQAPPDGLGAFRRDEDERAWIAVGRTPDRHDWLGYPDGRLDAVPYDELVDRVAAFLEAERPDVVFTFGPDGVSGHPDHIRIGRATDEAFHRVRAEGGVGLRRLVHGVIPQLLFDRMQVWRAEHGLPVWDPQRVYHLRGVPDGIVSVRVNTRPVSHLVLAGLKEHRSQRHVLFDDLLDEEWRAALRREFHAIVWPPRDPGAPLLTDVFEGLD
ncbi:PIG-L deacetylase family protein [Planctomonas psychrotolerans]|uniref:PIG-L deacetylase family protein n=1 Tax=Planctomonas psychrotolerans TaxID=2528712 RepID=UPI001239AE85|nr:PIG-L family deacetylase [Planctomonas psychrotolerans]